MELPKAQIEKLKEIVANDYSIALSDNEARDFGMSLLRLTRLASVALAREGSKKILANK